VPFDLVTAVDNCSLQENPLPEFKHGFYCIGNLYPALHADGALEHGSELSHDVDPDREITKVEQDYSVPSLLTVVGQ
jgi:hypothetical protein